MATSGDLRTSGLRVNLLPALTITTAVSATATTAIEGLSGMKYLIAQAKFVGGTDGTSVKAYVQTSVDGGVAWIDVMSFAFANTAAVKVSAVVMTTALAAGVAPADGALADNTILNGLLGDRVRLKYVTTGTYSGGTSLEVDVIAKG